MSSLNKNHPFRESITHSQSSSSSESSNSTPSASGEYSSGGAEKRNLLSSLSPKARLYLLLSLGGIVCYGYVSLYDTLYPSSSQAESMADLKMATRNVEDARRSAGLFGRMFCRGIQRSRFCQ